MLKTHFSTRSEQIRTYERTYQRSQTYITGDLPYTTTKSNSENSFKWIPSMCKQLLESNKSENEKKSEKKDPHNQNMTPIKLETLDKSFIAIYDDYFASEVSSEEAVDDEKVIIRLSSRPSLCNIDFDIPEIPEEIIPDDKKDKDDPDENKLKLANYLENVKKMNVEKKKQLMQELLSEDKKPFDDEDEQPQELKVSKALQEESKIPEIKIKAIQTPKKLKNPIACIHNYKNVSRLIKYFFQKNIFVKSNSYTDAFFIHFSTNDNNHSFEHGTELFVNKIPGFAQLACKNTTFEILNKYRNFHKDAFKFYPKTFMLPIEYNKYSKYHKSKPKKTFISKINNSSQGIGCM